MKIKNMLSEFRGPRCFKRYIKSVEKYGHQYVYLLVSGFKNFLNVCIDTKQMEFIQDYDPSKWELINNEYTHIVEHGDSWDE